MRRVVIPELLDHLPQDDPAAERSRADLRRINFLMGNGRWVTRTLRRFPEAVKRGVCEWGAGDGMLAARIARAFPQTTVTGCDLAPRPAFPAEVDQRIEWRQGDLFSSAKTQGGVLVASLFLHHFGSEGLAELGRRCLSFDVLVFSEPDLARLPLLHARLLCPFVNHVTRHDMRASILAGFGEGEIARLLELDPARWHVVETSTWRGARRVIAWRG
jgi:hypothetical protein